MEDINSKNAGLTSEPASPSLKSLAGGYADSEENSGLVKFGRTAQKVCPRTRGAEKTNYPLPPLAVDVWMLLKTIDGAKNGGDYPTIFMIINGLLTNLIRTVSCFQYDSLWKSLKIVSIPDRTHDVYDRKWLRLKRGNAALLFSIEYRQQNEGNCARCGVEPTMCMMGKRLEAKRLRSVISYVIENRARSSLAPKMNGLRTQDVHGGQGVRAKGIYRRFCMLLKASHEAP